MGEFRGISDFNRYLEKEVQNIPSGDSQLKAILVLADKIRINKRLLENNAFENLKFIKLARKIQSWLLPEYKYTHKIIGTVINIAAEALKMDFSWLISYFPSAHQEELIDHRSDFFQLESYQECLDLFSKDPSLKNVEKEFLEKNAFEIRHILTYSYHPVVEESLFKIYPQLFSNCSLGEMRMAVTMNQVRFVEYVLKSPHHLQEKDVLELLDMAYKTHHLGMIKALTTLYRFSFSNSYPQNLKLEEIKDENALIEKIAEYATVSRFEDIYELTDHFPAVLKILPKVFERVSISTRYPNGKMNSGVANYKEKNVDVPSAVKMLRYFNGCQLLSLFDQELELDTYREDPLFISQSSLWLMQHVKPILDKEPFEKKPSVTISFDSQGNISRHFNRDAEFLKERLNEFHYEIVKLKVNSYEDLQSLKAKIARTYWLIATTYEKENEAFSVAMFWLTLINQFHNRPVPIPKTEYFALEKVARLLPLETFIKYWDTFFEPTSINNNTPIEVLKCDRMNIFLEEQIKTIKKGSEISNPSVAEKILNFVKTESKSPQFVQFVYLTKQLADLTYPEDAEMILKALEKGLGLTTSYPNDDLWISKIICAWIEKKQIVFNTLILQKDEILKLFPHLTYFHLKNSSHEENMIHQILTQLPNVRCIVLENETFKTLPALNELKNLKLLEIKDCKEFNTDIPSLPSNVKLNLIGCDHLEDKFSLKEFDFTSANFFFPKNNDVNQNDLTALLVEIGGEDEKKFLQSFQNYFQRNGSPLFNSIFSPCQIDLDEKGPQYLQNKNFASEFSFEKEVQSLIARLIFKSAPVLLDSSFWQSLIRHTSRGYLTEIFPILNPQQQTALLKGTSLNELTSKLSESEKSVFFNREFHTFFYYSMERRKSYFNSYKEFEEYFLIQKQKLDDISKVISSEIPIKENKVLTIPEVTHPCDFEVKSDLIHINDLLKSGRTFARPLLAHLCISNNNSMLEFALEKIPDEYLEADARRIVLLLMKLDNPHLFEIFFKRYSKVIALCTPSICQHAIQKGYDLFIEWILNKEIKFDQNELEILQSVCAKTFHLKNMKAVDSYAQRNQIKLSVSYHQRLNIENLKDKDKTIKLMFNLALNSPLENVYEILNLYPQLQKYLPEVLRLLSVVVRFPHPSWHRHAMQNQSDLNNRNFAYFNNQSFAYAQENLTTIADLKIKLNELNRRELLDAIVRDRCARFEKNSPTFDYKKFGYNRYRTQDSSIHFTAWFRSRYLWSKRHLMNLINDQNNPLSKDPTVEFENNIIRFNYIDEKSEKHPLTSITWGDITGVNDTRYTDTFLWVHTPPSSINSLQNHLEVLHQEIVHFKLDIHNREEFDAKVARCYWLMATLCEMGRGTPHNVMIWLNLIYEHHHLPPPIPKIEHFFLDNTALQMPFEVFIKRWNTFFEPPFKIEAKD